MPPPAPLPLQISLINYTLERQLRAMRVAYARNLLRLDFEWYDTHRAGEAVSRLSEATLSVGEPTCSASRTTGSAHGCPPRL